MKKIKFSDENVKCIGCVWCRNYSLFGCFYDMYQPNNVLIHTLLMMKYLICVN
jgi:hypothetical protein